MTDQVDEHHNLSCLVDACVMRICDKGCRFVYQTIDRMRASEQVCETEQLTPALHKAVLKELEEVMAVYDGRVCDISADGNNGSCST